MIGLLRLVSLLNTAGWFGVAVCALLVARLALFTPEMQGVLGPRNFPYYSVAIAHVVDGRLFYAQAIASGVAVLCVLIEWLYLAKIPPRFWRWLLAILVGANLFNGVCVRPMLWRAHQAAYAVNVPAESRKSSARAFRAWQITGDLFNLLAVSGLGVYVWRVANPPDATRFLSPTKFRS